MTVSEITSVMKGLGAIESSMAFFIYIVLEDASIELCYNKEEVQFKIEINVDGEGQIFTKYLYEIHGIDRLFGFAIQKYGEMKFEQGKQSKIAELKEVLEIK